MSYNRISLGIFCRIAFFSVFFSLVLIPSISAQFYDLDIHIPHTTVYQGRQNVAIPIHMANHTDTVAGFELTIVTDNPELISFNTTSVDTTGTLTSGWQFIDIDTIYETGINIRALANSVSPPTVNGIGYPQGGSVPLIKILADIGYMPDSIPMSTESVDIVVNLDDFGFSDQSGYLIGLEFEFYYDTLWYNCTEYYPGDTICNIWEEVEGPPADTMVIDSLHPYFDTTQIGVSGGQITIKDNCFIGAGDADCSGGLNLLDIVYIINYLYKDGPEPFCIADCNCDCVLNLLDVTCIISYLYGTGDGCNCCSCAQWLQNCAGSKTDNLD